jgi:hypothetical protein
VEAEEKKRDKARLPGGHRALPDPLFSRADPSRRRAPSGRGSFPPNPELGVPRIRSGSPDPPSHPAYFEFEVTF